MTALKSEGHDSIESVVGILALRGNEARQIAVPRRAELFGGLDRPFM